MPAHSVSVEKLEDRVTFLRYIDNLKHCEGCPTELYPNIESSSTAVKEGDAWYGSSCKVLSSGTTCSECRKLHVRFSKRAKVLKERKPRTKSTTMKSLRRKVIRATSQKENIRQELATMRRQLCEVSDKNIDKALSVLPEKQKLAFVTALKTAQKN
ncbi:unnamed protein product [Ixodes persulcatus]